MREIKFRGLRTNGKGWVYGDLNQHDIHNGTSIRENGCIINAVIPESVGQFTGLKDKNGKEIFEGDICNHLGDVATIVFWEGSFIFDKYYIHNYALTNFACCRTFETIGNTTENPELLSNE